MRMAHFGEAPALEALLRHGADPTLRQPNRQGRNGRNALEICQDALKFWESIPKEDLKPEAAAARTLGLTCESTRSGCAGR